MNCLLRPILGKVQKLVAQEELYPLSGGELFHLRLKSSQTPSRISGETANNPEGRLG